MSSEVEIWFDSPPPRSALAESLARFGHLHEMRDGSLRLVEGDEEPSQGVQFKLVDTIDVPPPVLRLAPNSRAYLRASAVLSGSRGFWLGRVAAELQKQLGGVVYIPSSLQAYPDAATFERSWPADHGGHGGHEPADHELANHEPANHEPGKQTDRD